MGRYLPFEAHWDANNHMLNSLVSIIFYRLFGNSEFVLRLANLITFPIYLYFIFQISKLLSGKLMKWAFILALCFAHGFIEFFAYTRGYGMSMAFLMGAIWYLMQAFKTNHIKYYALSLLFICITQTANLTLVSTAIVIIALLFFKMINTINQEKPKTIIQKTLLIIILGILPLVFFSYISFILKDKDLLYYGQATGFWNITIKTQLDFILALNTRVAAVLAMIIFSTAILIFIRLAFRKDLLKNLDNIQFIFFYLLISNIIAIFMLNSIFKINFPEDRTGTYLYVYLIGAFVFLVDKIKFESHLLVLILMLPLLLVPLDFIFSMNFIKASIWPIDRIPHRYYDKVNEYYSPGEYPPSVGGYRLRHFCWSYLCFKDGGNLAQVYSGSYPGLDTDFQIAKAEEIPNWRTYYDSLDYDRTSGLYLLKRNQKINKKFLFKSDIAPMDTDAPGFFNYLQRDCADLKGKSLYMELDLHFESKIKPFRAWVVAEVVTDKHETLRYEFLALDWLKTDWSGEQGKLKNILQVHELPDEAKTLKVYLWNIDHVPFMVKASSISFYELIRDFPSSEGSEQN